MNYIFFCYLLLFFFSFGFIYFVGYNMFIVLVYLELAALSVSAMLVITSFLNDNHYAEFFAVALMAAVGAESAIAISLLIAINSLGFRLNAREFSQLKGLGYSFFYVLDYFFWPAFYIYFYFSFW
jgi:NADH:ubiquinone oxidoreductase subunit K